MLKTLIIFFIGLTPWLLSLWILRRAQAQAREQIRAVRQAVSSIRLPEQWASTERQYVEGVGYLIGDITCQFNARSAYIRCAVNPYGPCKDCPAYEPRSIDVHC